MKKGKKCVHVVCEEPLGSKTYIDTIRLKNNVCIGGRSQTMFTARVGGWVRKMSTNVYQGHWVGSVDVNVYKIKV